MEMISHLQLLKAMVINWVAIHTNLDLTKALLSMAVEVTIMRCQNLLMKIRTIIDLKDTTVVPKVISMIFFLLCLRINALMHHSITNIISSILIVF